MESASESDGSRGAKAILRSPTVIFSLVLVAVYIIIGAIVGNFFEPIQLQNIFVDLVVQCDVPTPIFPWTVLTAIFLHVSILHIASNVFFLPFFVTGMVGSLGFVGYDLLVYSLAPNAFVPDCAVGASGAIYGIMGTAVGLKVVLLLIFLLGLDIFANGGGPAHLGGLVAGLILRRYWSLGGGTFRGI